MNYLAHYNDDPALSISTTLKDCLEHFLLSTEGHHRRRSEVSLAVGHGGDPAMGEFLKQQPLERFQNLLPRHSPPLFILHGTNRDYFPYGRGMNLLKIRILMTVLLTAFASPGWAQDSEIQKHTRAFLDAYASGDRQVILASIDQKNIMMYGSDAAEIVHGSDALLKLVTADQRLWGGSARFGPMEHVSLVQSHSLASLFFDISFSVGGRPPVPVRVAAVWKRTGKHWLLVQSSNAVVTEHQSASELLEHP